MIVGQLALPGFRIGLLVTAGFAVLHLVPNTQLRNMTPIIPNYVVINYYLFHKFLA